MSERFTATLKLISSHIVLILALLVSSCSPSTHNVLFLLIPQTVLPISYFSGYWEFFGLRFRRIFCAGIELILVVLLVHGLIRGIILPANLNLAIILSLTEVYLLILLIRIMIVIYKKDSLSMDIEFPFSIGNYLVTDGGNSRISRLMNYHYYSVVHRKNKTNHSMLYATDIVKTRDDRHLWLPLKNEEYPVFNETVYSPMDGTVVKVVNDIPDNEPWKGNYPYNTGNTVVIRKDNYFMLLGHLKKGSINMKEGETVKAGDPVASAGNSGWTERPHLHMQLIKSESPNFWTGTGICIRYKNKNLYKNRCIGIITRP